MSKETVGDPPRVPLAGRVAAILNPVPVLVDSFVAVQISWRSPR